MFAITEPNIAIAAQESAGKRSVGAVCSLALHIGAVLLIIFGLPSLWNPPAEAPLVVPVNIVQFGDQTTAPAADQKAAVPQEQASETASVDAPEAVPVPQTPPPAPQPELPTSKAGPATAPRAETHPRPKPPAPADELTARLQALAHLRQPQAQVPPAPRQQDGAGTSNVTASSEDATRGAHASYAVKDFLRAQIERHWTMEKAVQHLPNAVVLIHLTLNRDGTVASAEVVPDPRYRNDDALRELAYSARNAALMSSPLTLPPGRYDEVRDIILDFNPRDVLR
jgi:outer membrane biosynthesis protein TonB